MKHLELGNLIFVAHSPSILFALTTGAVHPIYGYLDLKQGISRAISGELYPAAQGTEIHNRYQPEFLVIDYFLCNGNDHNRFVKVPVQGKEMYLSKADVVLFPEVEIFQSLSEKLMVQHFEKIDFSIADPMGKKGLKEQYFAKNKISVIAN